METTAFGPLRVQFDADALRPRPWTVLQAEWAAELAPSAPPGAVVELCAGVGHIGQAAAALSGRELVQVELDPDACLLAARNADDNGLGERVEVRCGDMTTVLAADERFAIVLADPPYLSSHEVDDWPDDPERAIDGGEDGLDLHRRCLDVAAHHLAPGGLVLLQARGRTQIDALAEDLSRVGLACVEVREVDPHRAVARLHRQST